MLPCASLDGVVTNGAVTWTLALPGAPTRTIEAPLATPLPLPAEARGRPLRVTLSDGSGRGRTFVPSRDTGLETHAGFRATERMPHAERAACDATAGPLPSSMAEALYLDPAVTVLPGTWTAPPSGALQALWLLPVAALGAIVVAVRRIATSRARAEVAEARLEAEFRDLERRAAEPSSIPPGA